MRRRVVGVGAIGALVLSASVASVARAQAPPAPTPAPAPASAAAGAPAKAEAPPQCTDCHEDQGKSFPRNPHARLPLPAERPIFGPGSARTGSPKDSNASAACQSCHGDGAKHMESAGEDKSDLRVFKTPKAADFCTTCHSESKSHASFRTGMHANSETVRCTTCHSIHTPEKKSAHLTVQTPQALCQSCHPTHAATMKEKPFTHRPVAGLMDCVSCHDPHGRPGRESLKLTRAGELPCLSCHSEKRGPFVFEHPPGLTGLSADSASNCLRCHETHGSSNPKQLVRARVDQLCLECHSAIPLGGGTLGSQPPSFHNLALPRYRNCTTCHVAIHGSNLSPQLLK